MKFIFAILVFSSLSFGAIPPVNELIKNMFATRKDAPVQEASFTHQVNLNSGESVTFEERLVREGSKVFAIWKANGVAPFLVVREKDGYKLGDRKLTIRSHLFTKYFVFGSPENFKEQLVQERFLRRDQLLQHSPKFNPEGDPRTWPSKEEYLKHPDIAIHFFDDNTSAVRVIGSPEINDKRVWYIEKSGVEKNPQITGLRRIEWSTSGESAAWDFGSFETLPGIGAIPKSMVFEFNGAPVVHSSLVRMRSIEGKAMAELKTALKSADAKANIPANIEGALRMVLSYR